MLKKSIVYQNAFGEEKTREAFFALSQEDLIRINKRHSATFENFDANSTEVEDLIKSVDVIRDFVRTAYFETDADGEAFNKSDEVKDKFMSSFAAATLIEDLVTNESAANEFMRGVVSHIKNDELHKALNTSGVIS